MVLKLEHMLDINRLLQKEDRGSTLFMVSADDLKEWAESLIKDTIALVESKNEPKYYTREELSNILHVSVQTCSRLEVVSSQRHSLPLSQ